MGKLAEVTAVSSDTMAYLYRSVQRIFGLADVAPAELECAPAQLSDLWALWSERSRTGSVDHKLTGVPTLCVVPINQAALRHILTALTETKWQRNCEPCWLASVLACRIVYLMRNTFESNFHDQIASKRPQSFGDMETSMTVPRIVLADDQKEMLRTIALVLGDEFSIIGTAENGKHAVELTTELAPDVLVLDISMPVVNGIEAASRLRALGSRARVVFLTINADPDFVEAARSVGALGYVLKESLALDLAPAIRTVIEGNSFTSPAMQLH